MEKLMLFIFAAIVVEAVISWSNTLFVEKRFQWKVLLALALAALIVFDLNLNFFALFQVTEQLPWVGQIFTVIVISRGSSYVWELYNKLTNWKDMNKAAA